MVMIVLDDMFQPQTFLNSILCDILVYYSFYMDFCCQTIGVIIFIVKNICQKYRNSSSVINPYLSLIAKGICIICTKSFYVGSVCSSILYRLMLSLLMITYFLLKKYLFEKLLRVLYLLLKIYWLFCWHFA